MKFIIVPGMVVCHSFLISACMCNGEAQMCVEALWDELLQYDTCGHKTPQHKLTYVDITHLK